jgi:hypothetical protein
MTRNTTADLQLGATNSTSYQDHSTVSHRTARGSDDLGTTVVLTVADILDTDPLDLTPSLNEILDADALNSLFDSVDRETETSLTFSEWGCVITVFADGRIIVERDE